MVVCGGLDKPGWQELPSGRTSGGSSCCHLPPEEEEVGDGDGECV